MCACCSRVCRSSSLRPIHHNRAVCRETGPACFTCGDRRARACGGSTFAVLLRAQHTSSPWHCETLGARPITGRPKPGRGSRAGFGRRADGEALSRGRRRRSAWAPDSCPPGHLTANSSRSSRAEAGRAGSGSATRMGTTRPRSRTRLQSARSRGCPTAELPGTFRALRTSAFMIHRAAGKSS